MTFERFMDLSLYHPEHGYYATAARRTGRAGDFFTNVDVGPVFGELLARQFAEMHTIVGGAPFDLVEAAAANGQFARDVLDALAAVHPAVYDVLRLHLADPSLAGLVAQPGVLGPHAIKLGPMPERVRGVVFANELLDALPCHAVCMRAGGLREIVVAVREGLLVEEEAAPSTPELAEYFERLGVTLETGWRAEVNLRAIAWVRDAARRLARGFLVLIDYGHPARELYSASHSAGTRASYRAHVAGEAWLARPGEVDITAHVDLTSIRRTAEEEGLTTIAVLDQTYFVLGLGLDVVLQPPGPGTADDAVGMRALERRLALKTLMLPGGLGSTLKVMIFGRGVGTPPLLGCSQGVRLT
jgi:SAM-dependent MidA family methyltransferase